MDGRTDGWILVFRLVVVVVGVDVEVDDRVDVDVKGYWRCGVEVEVDARHGFL